MKRTSSRGRPYWPTMSASSLSSFRSGGFLARRTEGAFEIVDDRIECAVDVVGRAMEAQTGRAMSSPGARAARSGCGSCRCPAPRKEHHLPFTGLRQVPAPHKQVELFVAPNEFGHSAACKASKRLSTEAGRNTAQIRTGPAMPLSSCAPEVLKLEQVAKRACACPRQ